MCHLPKQGDLVDERFKVRKLLGRGSVGAAYKALDLQSGLPCLLKVIAKQPGGALAEYTDHLLSLQQSLSGLSLPGLLLPFSVGETENFAYQALELIQPKARGLDEVIRTSGPLIPERAMRILTRIARALAPVHERGIIHGDLKPANIILANPPEDRVFVIDFGMVKHNEADDSIILVGTHQYMHPVLKAGAWERPRDSDVCRFLLRGRAGSYLDMYSLGIVTLEMLTTETEVPAPLSEKRLASFLRQKNPGLGSANPSDLTCLVHLMLRMLTIRSDKPGSTLEEIRGASETLAKRFAEAVVPGEKDSRTTKVQPTQPGPAREEKTLMGIREAVEGLETMTDSIRRASEVLIRTTERLELLPHPQRDTAISADMNAAFANALARIRTSWRVGVAMTIACFCLISAMVICAVTFAVVSGKSGWTLIFAGASVPMVIGTLIWRPYDRVFRATILAQQLEMIHLQTSATFRSTSSIDRRIGICRDAIEKLHTLLEEHAIRGGTGEPPEKPPGPPQAYPNYSSDDVW
jgi:serine/threonine protein kinase